jgi:hypothetical protein
VDFFRNPISGNTKIGYADSLSLELHEVKASRIRGESRKEKTRLRSVREKKYNNVQNQPTNFFFRASLNFTYIFQQPKKFKEREREKRQVLVYLLFVIFPPLRLKQITTRPTKKNISSDEGKWCECTPFLEVISFRRYINYIKLQTNLCSCGFFKKKGVLLSRVPY